MNVSLFCKLKHKVSKYNKYISKLIQTSQNMTDPDNFDDLIEYEQDKDGNLSDDTQKDADFSPTPNKRTRHQNRTKVIETWTDEEINKLISEVETHPCIWNAGCKDYKNRGKRDSAWNEIAAAFEKKPAAQLTAKWQNLRIQYRASLTSSKKTKSGQGVSKVPHWKHHAQMSFVGTTEETQSVQSESNSVFDDVESASASSATNSNATTSGSSGKAVRNRRVNDETASQDDTDKKKEDLILSGMQVAIDKLQKPKKESDEIDVFGKYLVSELRKIKTDVYRQTTQRKLLQLLWQCIDEQPVNMLGKIKTKSTPTYHTN